MKRLNFMAGGRGLSLDDLQILQDELYKAVEEQHKGLGAFILSGCVASTVSTGSISAGLVYIDGRVLSFAGMTGVTFPVFIKQAVPTEIDPGNLETGGTANKRILYTSELVTVQPTSGEYITMSAGGGRSYWDAIGAEVVRTKGSQTVAGEKSFSNLIKATADILHSYTEGSVTYNITLRILRDMIVNRTTNIANWTNIDLSAGFTTGINNAGHTFSFKRDAFGNVHIRGYVVRTDNTKNIICILPEGIRPGKSMVFPIKGGNIFIQSNGYVSQYDSAINNLYMDGIIFDTV